MDDIFSHLCPAFATRIQRFLGLCAADNLNVAVFQGYRSFAMENRIFHYHPEVTRATGGLSWHNYGLAADIVFKDAKGNWSWDTHKFDYYHLGAMGKLAGLQWGGDWKSLRDLCHFEYHNGLKIHEALALYQQKGMQAVWDRVFPNAST